MRRGRRDEDQESVLRVVRETSASSALNLIWTSVAVARVLTVELAQHRLEADLAEAAVADALRGLDRARDHFLGRRHDRAAGLGGDLDRAGALEVVHQGEGLGDRAPERQGAVVAQEH